MISRAQRPALAGGSVRNAGRALTGLTVLMAALHALWPAIFMNEITISVSPSSHRDMVKHALGMAGFKITGSGYNLVTKVGDIWAYPPPGAQATEFHPQTTATNMPEGERPPTTP